MQPTKMTEKLQVVTYRVLIVLRTGKSKLAWEKRGQELWKSNFAHWSKQCTISFSPPIAFLISGRFRKLKQKLADTLVFLILSGVLVERTLIEKRIK